MADGMTNGSVPGMAMAWGDGNPQYSPCRAGRSPGMDFPWAFRAQGGTPSRGGGMCAAAQWAWVAEDGGEGGMISNLRFEIPDSNTGMR